MLLLLLLMMITSRSWGVTLSWITYVRVINFLVFGQRWSVSLCVLDHKSLCPGLRFSTALVNRQTQTDKRPCRGSADDVVVDGTERQPTSNQLIRVDVDNSAAGRGDRRVT